MTVARRLTRRRPGRALAPVLIFLCSCVHAPLLEQLPADTADAVELERTPFYPQQDYYCGPSALAAVLQYSGVDLTGSQVLADQVYIPGRRGSLQPELLAATRRHRRIPYIIQPTLAALIANLQAGVPVLVLQDLAPAGAPAWHYAVVIGFDRGDDTIILRSGRKYRLVMDSRKFMRSWRRADSWGFVALLPGQLPVDGDARRYLQALADFQSVDNEIAMSAAYSAATDRWPQNESAWIGLAEAQFRAGKLDDAIATLKGLLAHVPGSIAAHNNLAFILNELGCRRKAVIEISKAFDLAKEQGRFLRQVMDTKQRITAAANQDRESPVHGPAMRAACAD